jgi:hypothetical protein
MLLVVDYLRGAVHNGDGIHLFVSMALFVRGEKQVRLNYEQRYD